MPIIMKLRIIVVLCVSLGDTSTQAANLSGSDCKESNGSFSQRCTERMKQLDETIRRYTNNTCRHSAECKTVGYGTKLCGGPALYLPYSRTSDSETSFMNEVMEYNALSRIYADYISKKLGIVSDCALVRDPGAVCINSRCVLRQHPW